MKNTPFGWILNIMHIMWGIDYYMTNDKNYADISMSWKLVSKQIHTVMSTYE
jgi:hypothetical protein